VLAVPLAGYILTKESEILAMFSKFAQIILISKYLIEKI
jgi:hypothetical protein